MDILTEIINYKRQEISHLLASRSALKLQAYQSGLSSSSFKEALLKQGTSIIAEVKKASPSAGIICHDFKPVEIALNYVKNGASAISVLTDEKFFKGHLDYLQAVRQKVDVPIIRKDFIIDALQIYQAKIVGASAFLLIASVLTVEQMAEFISIGEDLGLDALVEVHNQDELDKALLANPKIIGVNNRNLRTFKTSLQTSFDMIDAIKCAGIEVAVSESGIKTQAEIESLYKSGYDAFLIGESLMRGIL